MRILTGDIGGSKTLLQLADYADGEYCVIAEERYDSRAYDDLEPILACFMGGVKEPRADINGACLAIAGPIRGEEVKPTNLPWSVHAGRLQRHLGGAHMRLLNDLEGAGYGIACLEPSDLLVLHAGDPETHRNCALIGAGTGLGEAWMARRGDAYEVFAGEGGHVDFAPRDALEVDLLVDLQATIGRVSCEHLLSGAGLKRIFDFLAVHGYGAVSPALARDLRGADPAAAICDHAVHGGSELARLTLERFVRIYGAQAANLALTVNARGGVYVVGGIAPKIIAALRAGGFMAAFLDNPSMSGLLAGIPVSIVLNPKVALLGAREMAIRAVMGHAV